MKPFTRYNTDYIYSDTELSVMNDELIAIMIDNNVPDDDDALIAYYAERIMNAH